MSERKPTAKKAAAKRPAKKKAPAAKKAAVAKSPKKRAPAKKRAPKKSTEPKVDPRDKQVLELRRAGLTIDTIADRLKFKTPAQAHEALARALDATEPPTPEESKRLELDRLDRLQAAAWSKAMRGDLAALDRLVRLAQERLKVVSTDPLPVTEERGPIETATAVEVTRLEKNAPALGASALVLARIVDENRGDANAAATAARELRITMSQLRGLAGQGDWQHGEDENDPDSNDKGQASVTWLDELRERAENKRRGTR